jgi:hypothetical protein
MEEPQSAVEDQEKPNDRGLRVLAENYLKQDRSLEHPRNRCPELQQRSAQWMLSRVGHRVWAELVQTAAGFVARQTSRSRYIVSGGLMSWVSHTVCELASGMRKLRARLSMARRSANSSLNLLEILAFRLRLFCA